MLLRQLECSLEHALGEELSVYLEEEGLSTSLLKTPEEAWTFQVIVDTEKEEALLRKMNAFLRERLSQAPEITSRALPQKDWVHAVYQGFSPLTLGCFYVYGSHSQEAPPEEFLPLKVDAATAFGSGHHESTEGCLRALTLLSDEHSFQNPLDMGCGSGILSLAMARLWNVSVLACDNDPEAVRVTTYNAALNGLSSLITAQVSEGFESIPGKTFDVITANILAGPLCQMAPDAVRALKSEGIVILSGLLQTQAQTVIEAYQKAGAQLYKRLNVGEWSTLIMQRYG